MRDTEFVKKKIERTKYALFRCEFRLMPRHTISDLAGSHFHDRVLSALELLLTKGIFFTR